MTSYFVILPSLFDQFMILPVNVGLILISPYTLVVTFFLMLLLLLYYKLPNLYIFFPYILFTLQQKKPVEKVLFLVILISFSFILMGNLIGFLPYATTITSQLSLTLLLAIWLVGGIFIEALSKFDWSMLQYYLPKHTSNSLSWLLIPIEVISFFIRPISLALRLFANTVCGHILMKLTGTCIVAIFQFWAPLTIVTGPIIFTGLVSFELFIAILQAYIFILLFTIYNAELNMLPVVFFLFLVADNLMFSISVVYLEEFWVFLKSFQAFILVILSKSTFTATGLLI